jgi:hypothetical protein
MGKGNANKTNWRAWLFQDLSSLGAKNAGSCNTNARRAIVTDFLRCTGGEVFLSHMVTVYETWLHENQTTSGNVRNDAIGCPQRQWTVKVRHQQQNYFCNLLLWNGINLVKFSLSSNKNDIWPLESTAKNLNAFSHLVHLTRNISELSLLHDCVRTH